MTFADQMPRRLIKLLGDGTSLTRQAIGRAVAQGRVEVVAEGIPVPAQLDRWIFGDDRVALDGALVRPRERQHTVLYHKPANVTATLSDTRGREDLSGPRATMPAGCLPIGRLDRETTGALLFSTDGDLLNAVLRPEHGVKKLYRLTIAEALSESDPRLAQLLTGVPTALGTLRAESWRIGDRRPGRAVVKGPPDRGETELWLTLHGGKNRQIRRMCQRTDLRLRQLHRTAVGPVALGALAEGSWRRLEDTEVERLWAATGGRDALRRGQRRALVRHARSAREHGEPSLRLEAWLRLTESDARPSRES